MKKKSLVLLMVLFLIGVGSCTVLAADQLVREGWYVVESDGKAVGFICDQTWDIDGGFRYVSDLTMLMEFLQSQTITVTEHLEEVADDNFQARSFKDFVTTNSSQTVMTGEFTGDQIKVKVIADGGKEYNSTWSQSEPLYFSTSMIQALVKQGLKVGTQVTSATWDYVNQKPTKCTLTVEKQVEYHFNGKTIPAFELVVTQNNETTHMIYDAQGEMYWGEMTSAANKMTIRRTEKDQIPQLQTAEVDVLMIPGNIQVSRPFSSLTSEITVSWRDVAFSEFRWEDNRQKLKDHVINGNEHQVVVSIAKDERDFKGKVQIPVQDKFLANYLADTQYIMPSLPAVKELAKQIIGNETDGWIVTQRLSEWVFNNVKYGAIPETLTAEQILEKKSGKCVEYAVLFASLARSAGLPTRMALGERYQDAMWVGHMWNEVWMDGEWITVDASHNQISPDALLLKFVDSDTVMGTQIVRRGLTGKLKIHIDNVKLPEGADPQRKTGIVGQTYTNAEFACQLTAPEQWSLVEAQDQGLPMLVMQPAGDPAVQAILLMFSVPAGTTPDIIMESRIPAIKNLLPGFELLGQEKVTLLDQPAVLASWTMTQTIQYRQQNLIMISGDIGYLFVFSAPENQWEQYQAGFAKVLEGFQMLK